MINWPLLVLIFYEQELRLKQEIADIEKDTGYKLRVLAQNYPVTPGMFYVLSSADHCINLTFNGEDFIIKISTYIH